MAPISRFISQHTLSNWGPQVLTRAMIVPGDRPVCLNVQRHFDMGFSAAALSAAVVVSAMASLAAAVVAPVMDTPYNEVLQARACHPTPMSPQCQLSCAADVGDPTVGKVLCQSFVMIPLPRLVLTGDLQSLPVQRW